MNPSPPRVDRGAPSGAPTRTAPEVDRVVRAVRAALDAAIGPQGPRPRLVVALSGGLDSCVLLHALRFALEGDVAPAAAHFDHRMRTASVRDADWVGGLCRAWDVDLVVGEAEDPPTSEEEARAARYAFLESVRARWEPARLLTAHHADDQAETVLFRALRGTGVEGLAGIPVTREPGIVRPLLGVWREELESYAERCGLSWREDATNEHLGYARNVLRHEILPSAEAKVAPGARRALVRLAHIARSDALAWCDALEIVLATLDVEREADPRTGTVRVSVDREALAALGQGLRARVLRHLVGTTGEEDVDRRLSAGATERAADFVAAGSSGGRIELGAGLELGRELDRIVIGSGLDRSAPDREVTIGAVDGPGPVAGEAEARLAGRAVLVRWRTAPSDPEPGTGGSGAGGHDAEGPAADLEWAAFPVRDLAFPLRVRARRPGDRIAQGAGTRKVKKAMLEARIPPGERDEVPVLVDAGDRVLWIPGVARAAIARPAEPARPDEPDESAGAAEPTRPDRSASGNGGHILWIGIVP